MPNKLKKSNKNILVIGLGLIGASLCRTLKDGKKYEKIIGHDSNEEVMDYAIKKDYVDEIEYDLKNSIQKSDIIIFCVPVKEINKILDSVSNFFNTEKIFTDTLSTKNIIKKYFKDNDIENINNFIFSHPMAGTENYGIKNSQADLFKNATVLVSPLTKNKLITTNNKNFECINDLWKSIDCNVSKINDYDHDEILAAFSHVPHFISFSLSKILKDSKNHNFQDYPWAYPNKGSLSDMLRIANSDAEAWANIFSSNSSQIQNFLDNYILELEKLKLLINKKDTDELISYLKKSKPLK